ncbi:Adenylyl cyclase 13E [Carabus blaptoides fortunei]
MSFKRHRVSSVSFTRSHTLSDANNVSDVPSDDDDNIQISMAPHIQTLLARASRRRGCMGRCLPIAFERTAHHSWCDPRFDSEILEGQYKTSAFPQLRLRFRYALLYVLLVSLSWFVYFLSSGLGGMSINWPILCSVLAVLVILVIGLLLLTHTDYFRVHFLFVSLCVALLLYTLSLCFVLFAPSRFTPHLEFSADISPVGHFSLCVQVLLLVYTMIPLPLYVCVLTGLLYSITFELLTLILHDSVNYHIIVRFIAHLCIHLIGLHILIMTNVRMRGTFMKVGQSLLVRRQLEMEKQLKEKMIHSVMPPKIADWLMNDDANFAKNSEARSSNPETTGLKYLFRPFNMHRMENVSILFADIVGFTKMSSNKSAEELVGILNDLFERFDHLCSLHECEKISTLGDCYYCVSGCPEPRVDHAKCCVEMGLGMIQAIKQFDNERNEGVNMRVGVHTGTVLCGIVGTRRFKFDVWSNDVTLANRMESTGKPGMVHISEKTCDFLPDQYVLDDGDPVFGYKTYFIVGRKTDRHSSFNGSLHPTTSSQQKFDSLQLIISPPTSPPSVSPIGRPRVLSCTDGNMKTHHNPNQLSPNMFKVKANSLPSILDSDCEDTEQNEQSNVEDTSVKSPTSTASCEKNYINLKKWKIPRFLRKQSISESEQPCVLQSVAKSDINELQSSNGYQQVPAIVETNCCKNLSALDNDTTIRSDSSWSSITKTEEKDKSLVEENKNDIIDVKSYISQSRSDVGQYDYTPSELSHFIRSGSYKSQCVRSPNDLLLLDRVGSNRSHAGRPGTYEVSPVARARSATMATARVDMDCLEIPASGMCNFEVHRSECASVNSRKDSGIRSNSRRSSIQQQIYVMNQSSIPQEDLLHARVSGYYTSSQSTINSCSPQYGSQLPGPFYDQFGQHFQKLRKQSDLQLIRCVQDNFKSKHSYFMKPPLSNITLFFKSRDMEREYRANVHTISDRPGEMIATLATSRKEYNAQHLVNNNSSYQPLTDLTNPLINIHFKVPADDDIASSLLSNKNASLLYDNQTYIHSDSAHSVHIHNISLPLNSTNQLFHAYTTSSQSTQFVNDTTTVQIHKLYESEIFIDVFLLLVLVWFLNREFEIGYRLSFHADLVANRDKAYVQSMKNQADWLLHNIIPEHVADQLKKSAKYSENHKNVGIIFASIVNFNEMYDESYLGGKEYLRVLNELIADFDELLTYPEFKNVEKIKTIGSTFMAASGLNPNIRRESDTPYDHLYALMDFAMRMQKAIDDFNANLLEFNLILRVGYNFGDVTAGVIGTSKLYYDIWGDAVNIASRMDSTGVNGRIQVGGACLEVLEKRYEFEPRGSVYVKGKDNMNVYLLLRKKDGVTMDGME